MSFFTPTKIITMAALTLLVILACRQVAIRASIPADANLDVDTFKKEISQEGVTLIDVRTPGEFTDGHLEGAVLMDFKAPDFAAKVGKLDKDGIYRIYCRSGNRSGKALSIMRSAGLKDIAHLKNGIKSWIAAGEKTVQ